MTWSRGTKSAMFEHKKAIHLILIINRTTFNFFVGLCSDFLGNSPLLKHLGEAGLLHDVSALLARARSRDEGNLRKIQTQAKGELCLYLTITSYARQLSNNVSWTASWLNPYLNQFSVPVGRIDP